MSLTLQQRAALEYVRNTAGHATFNMFVEDHEPIGPQLWGDLNTLGLVRADEQDRVILTEAGQTELAQGTDVYGGGTNGN